MMRASILALALLAAPAHAQTASPDVEVTAPGPSGALAGSLIDPNPKAPLLVLLPGSGPTDRNGDNAMGVSGSPYRQLAQALSARDIATVRVDKRGMFGSRAAIADPNAVTIADYAADAHAWVDAMRARTGRRCVWLAGHSEGGLIALQAAQDRRGICGVVLIAAPGRPLGEVMRDQFRSNPANAPILESAMGMLDAFEAGRRVDPATLTPPLDRLFPAAVQGFVIDMFRYAPAKLAAALRVPLLVTQGDQDQQVPVGDAQALAKAASGATLVVIRGMTHVLRLSPGETPGAGFSTYRNAALPIAPALVDAIAAFVAKPVSPATR